MHTSTAPSSTSKHRGQGQGLTKMETTIKWCQKLPHPTFGDPAQGESVRHHHLRWQDLPPPSSLATSLAATSLGATTPNQCAHSDSLICRLSLLIV